MNIGEIIKSARQIKGISQTELARLLCESGAKITAQQISSWERQKYSPNHKSMIKLYEILGKSFETSAKEGDTSSLLSSAHPTEFTLVEKKKGAISAGQGLAPASDEVDFRLAFREDWLKKFGGADQLFVMRVEGDSMEPTLMENDMVLINKNTREVNAGGGIYAINWKGSLFVKRIQLNPNNGEIKIKSDNTQYDPQAVNPTDIQIEGKVIWYGREMR